MNRIEYARNHSINYLFDVHSYMCLCIQHVSNGVFVYLWFVLLWTDHSNQTSGRVASSLFLSARRIDLRISVRSCRRNRIMWFMWTQPSSFDLRYFVRRPQHEEVIPTIPRASGRVRKQHERFCGTMGMHMAIARTI